MSLLVLWIDLLLDFMLDFAFDLLMAGWMDSLLVMLTGCWMENWLNRQGMILHSCNQCLVHLRLQILTTLLFSVVPFIEMTCFNISVCIYDVSESFISRRILV